MARLGLSSLVSGWKRSVGAVCWRWALTMLRKAVRVSSSSGLNCSSGPARTACSRKFLAKSVWAVMEDSPSNLTSLSALVAA